VLSARRAEYEAEIAAIQADLRAHQQRVEIERRRARELVRRIAVLGDELGRGKEELDGILQATQQAEARGAAARERVDQETAEEQASGDDTQTELSARLRILEQQARSLIDNVDAASTPAPVGALAATVNARAADVSAREELALVDEANRLIFQYANWLYLISRQPRALEWAVSVQSIEELDLVRKRLEPIYADVRGTIGLSTPRYFTARISRQAIGRASSTSSEGRAALTFTVAPSLARFDQPAPIVVATGDEAHVGDEPHSIYLPLTAYLTGSARDTGGISRRWEQRTSELVFAPYVETEPGALHLLWDVWIVPKWSGNPPAELRTIGLRPLGPTEYFVNGAVEAQPVLRPREPNYSSTGFSYSRIRAQHKIALERIVGGDREKSLLDGTVPGMNYRSVLGRGLGNSWELVLPNSWSQLGSRAPHLDQLESIDIVFGYLVAPERGGSNIASSMLAPRLTEADIAGSPEEKKIADAQLCLGSLAELECAVDSYIRHMERGKVWSERVSGQSTDASTSPFGYEHSGAARASRARLLSDMASLMPNASRLADGEQLAENSSTFIERMVGAGGSGAREEASLLESLTKIFPALVSRPLLPERNRPLTVAEITHQIVRDEMLALPTEPSSVGPIELLRVWRSLEMLLGRADEKPEEMNSARQAQEARPTLLGEIAALDARLGTLIGLLDTN
jgi:hypothetical protein